MRKFTALAAMFALTLAGAGVAEAQTAHGHGTQTPAETAPGATDSQAGTMHDMMRMMMPMMMRMHGQMAGGDMMGAGPAGMMSMMDRDMMRMMMGHGMRDAQTPDDLSSVMQEDLAKFDADGNRSLSLSEFEALHTAKIREIMVDRFQHLDADGDGEITEAEIGMPAQRMRMRGPMGNDHRDGN